MRIYSIFIDLIVVFKLFPFHISLIRSNEIKNQKEYVLSNMELLNKSKNMKNQKEILRSIEDTKNSIAINESFVQYLIQQQSRCGVYFVRC